MINVTLPAGSISHKQPEGVGEVWLVTTPYDFTVNNLRQQLPVGDDYEGLRWCNQEGAMLEICGSAREGAYLPG